LAILAGLRKLSDIITQEVQQMPILDDIMDNPIIGPGIRQRVEIGLQKVIEEGRQEGRQVGRQEGEGSLVLRQLERRFGPVPAWARQKIDAMSLGDLEDMARRLFDAQGLEDLLRLDRNDGSDAH
jgi:predicted transposase YdaD